MMRTGMMRTGRMRTGVTRSREFCGVLCFCLRVCFLGKNTIIETNAPQRKDVQSQPVVCCARGKVPERRIRTKQRQSYQRRAVA